jgi:hypothetical protein
MYKRNQLEDAILRAESLDPAHEGAETRIRIKRLLDLDRKHTPGPEKLYGTTYAFYGADAPGTGYEVLFSSYEVFALWIGLRLLAAGFPQGRVVFLMRYYRDALEREHARILQTDLTRLFASSGFLSEDATDADRERLVREGRLVERIRDMVFLAVRGEPEAVGITTRVLTDNEDKRPANICRGAKELLRFMQIEGFAKRSVLTIELTNPAYQLAYWLACIPPIRRGRR